MTEATQDLQASILELIRITSTQLPADVIKAVQRAKSGEEPSSNAAYALDVIECNIDKAKDLSQPICQDTGSILFYVQVPVAYDQIEFTEITERAIIEATEKGFLRQNSVDSLSGKNSGNNLGPGSPNIHFHQWRKDHVEIILMLKGGGCENVGTQFALPHPKLGGRDIKGVENAILEAVLLAQGKGCGPGILGVCIGGDRASGYGASKEQLMRLLDDENENTELAELEQRVMKKANASGIGPMGFGGNTTLLGCKITALNRVPASFYVSMSYMCWAFRRQGVRLDDNAAISEWLY